MLFDFGVVIPFFDFGFLLSIDFCSVVGDQLVANSELSAGGAKRSLRSGSEYSSCK